MLRVVGIKNCSTVKKALNWLDENEIEYEFRDLKKDPLTEDQLLDLVNKLSLGTVLNKKGMKWRSLQVNDDELTDKDRFELLLEHQTMIKRPVLVYGEAVMVGFDPEGYQAFLDN